MESRSPALQTDSSMSESPEKSVFHYGYTTGVYTVNSTVERVVVQSLSRVWLFGTPRTATHQASLSFTISWSLLELMSIESVMPSNHLILCVPFSSCPQSFPASGSFLMSQFFTPGGQSIGASTWASVLPMNIQDRFPLGWTCLILQSKGLSKVFSYTAVQKHQFFSAQPSLWPNSHIHTRLLEKSALTTWTFVRKVTSLFFNMLS